MDLTLDIIKAKIFEANLYKNPDLDVWILADKLGVRENELSLFIKDEADMTVKAFINELRIQDLIKILDNAIIFNRISYYFENSGFKSRSPFERCFKRKTGMTIRDYIQILKKENKVQDTNSHN